MLWEVRQLSSRAAEGSLLKRETPLGNDRASVMDRASAPEATPAEQKKTT
jgi:hypothetical protein